MKDCEIWALSNIEFFGESKFHFQPFLDPRRVKVIFRKYRVYKNFQGGLPVMKNYFIQYTETC